MVTKLPSKMLIVLLSIQWLSHSIRLQLCAPSMRSLATLDLPTTRYEDFYVPILLAKLSEKLLTNVLKEYPSANPTIDQLIQMIHNEVKRLEQVAYISNNNQPKPPPPPKPPLPKVPPINGVLSETVPPGTTTALPAAVTLLTVMFTLRSLPQAVSKTRLTSRASSPMNASFTQCPMC